MNRFRRLRRSEAIRKLVRETHLNAEDLIQSYFLISGRNKKEPISSMPGIYRLSIDEFLRAVERYREKGGLAALIFGIPKYKDLKASEAYAKNGIVQQAIKAVKR